MISTEGLSYQYEKGSSFNFPNIACEDNDKLLILGKSGVGKTTLLHLLGGLMSPQSGNIRVNDIEMSSLKGKALDLFRGKNIGIIFQQYHFVQSLNVIENIMLAQSLVNDRTDIELCRSLLSRLNISHKEKEKLSSLSQGEKQRVAIARALVNKPGIILADEPTSALDDENCDHVLNLLEEQAEALGSTLIIVTHDTRLKDKFDQQLVL